MAHQWFGDYVTCKDWSHTWLNEGFATYYTHLYEGHKSGRDALLYGLYEDAEGDRGVLGQSARDTRPIVYRDYQAPMEQFDFRAYPKGSWVLHMLRSQLGEKLFREAVHTYLERHALGNVETEDLREVFEELSGQPLDRFFDQWVYHGGAPQLTISYSWLAEEKLARVSVKQTQETSDKVLLFHLPTKLRFVVDGKPVDKPIVINEAEEDFYFALDEEPTIVRFDPEYTLLAKVSFDVPEKQLQAQLANEDDAMGRVLACVALGDEGKNGNVAALKERLQKDKFYGVREAAAKALQEIGTEEAIAALVDSADQDDARVRRTVVEQLGRCYHDDANEKLLDVATDDDELPIVAAAAISALGRRSGDDATEAIEEALESRSFNNERMRAALAAIRDQRAQDFADELVELVSDGSNGLAADELGDAIGTLAAISQRGRRRDAAFDAVREYLDHPRQSVRTAAIAALGELRDPRARTLLEPFAAEGQNGRLRGVARGALERLDRNAEQAPEEVGELRRELRELREKYGELEESLEELKSKAEAKPKDDAEAEDDESVDGEEESDDDST
jgi:aminopeptidase N